MKLNGLCFFVGLSLAMLANFCTSAAQDAPMTTNMKLSPQWTDAEHFTFKRQSDTGVPETVTVVAETGDMTVISATDPGAKGAARDGFRGGVVPVSGPNDESTEIVFVNEVDQPVQTYWVDSSGDRIVYAKIAPGETYRQHTYGGHAWAAIGDDGAFYGSVIAQSPPLTAVIKTSFPKPKADKNRRDSRSRTPQPESEFPFQVRVYQGDFQYSLKTDGGETDVDPGSKWRTVPIPGLTTVEKDNDVAQGSENAKDDDGSDSLTRPHVSPDGKAVAVWIRTPGANARVHTIESSPAGGGRAKLLSQQYDLPGDAMEHYKLVCISTESWKAVTPDLPIIDFGYPNTRWRGGHELVVEKVDRGHQRFRLFAVDPLVVFESSQGVRTIIDEKTETFIWTAHAQTIPLVTYLETNDRVIYSSEKNGYRHLYMVNLDGEPTMNPITQGDFIVRKIIRISEKENYIDLVVGEFHDDQDPYHQHLVRVSLVDGNVTSLTDGDGDHEYDFSPDRKYVIVN